MTDNLSTTPKLVEEEIWMEERYVDDKIELG